MNASVYRLPSVLSGLIFLSGSVLQAQDLSSLLPERKTVRPVAKLQTAPLLQVETQNPATITLGRTASFTIVVRNAGESIAEGVVMWTELPAKVKFQRASQQPAAVDNNVVRFELGNLRSRGRREIQLDLLPSESGPIELATRVGFSTSTPTRMQTGKPDLAISAEAPASAALGRSVLIKVQVVNRGNGVAENIVVIPEFGDALVISEAGAKPHTLGSLSAGQSRELVYKVRTQEQGNAAYRFTATDATGAAVNDGGDVRITRSKLELRVVGPSLRHLNREGTWEIYLSNPGDGAARNISVVANIPAGLRVTTLERAANYDRKKNTLSWFVESVESGKEAILSMKAIATSLGEFTHQVTATGSDDLVVVAKRPLQVVGRPNLYATIVNKDGATEAPGTVGFAVLVANRGPVAAERVEVTVVLPEGLQAAEGDGYRVENNQIKFPALRLKPNQQQELHFETASILTGEHILQAHFGCEGMSKPLIAEGQAFVYDDSPTERLTQRWERRQANSTNTNPADDFLLPVHVPTNAQNLPGDLPVELLPASPVGPASILDGQDRQ